MNTAVINIKTDPQVKQKAQQLAGELGLSLSDVINSLLKQVIRTKIITLSVADEEPTEYMIKALKESDKDIKAGRVLSFNKGQDAVKYFEELITKDEKRIKKN